MNESSKSLIVLKIPYVATAKSIDRLEQMIKPIADEMNAKLIICLEGTDIDYYPGNLDMLIKAMQAQTNSINGLVGIAAELLNMLDEEEEEETPAKYLDGSLA